MKKLRTLEQLESFLDFDLSWRKQEGTNISFNIDSARDVKKDTSVRAGVVLLYSHWEGFIKSAAQAYLNYICFQGVSYKNLKNNFRALGIRENKFLGSEKSINYHLEIVELIRTPTGKFSVDPETAVDTKSNLKSSVLREIIDLVGFDYSPYELKENLIDERLLMNRNKIAHGDRNYDVQDLEQSFSELKREVFDMLDVFKSQVVTAANNGDYLEQSEL